MMNLPIAAIVLMLGAWLLVPTVAIGQAGPSPAKAPLVIAHRGFSSYAPENTLPAITAALDLGVDWVEIDVHLTADSELVVIHDATVDRTTNGKGRVKDMRLSELRSLDAGSWFAPQYAGTTLPTLVEVLESVAGRATLLIEIKWGPDGPYPGIERRVLETIAQYGAESWTVVQSFDETVMQNLRALNPAMPLHKLVTLVLPKGYVDHARQRGRPWDYEGVAAVNLRYKALTAKRLAKIHAAGLRCMVWTVNSEPAMRRLTKLGVDGIITDYPERLLLIQGRILPSTR